MGVEQIRKERCTNCGRCYDVCPMDVFQRLAGRTFIAYPDDCMCCYLCEIECPADALMVTGKRAREIPFPY
jgi:NAD-dependent dihydropyrimidine dehydrogenase PreA subunit